MVRGRRGGGNRSTGHISTYVGALGAGAHTPHAGAQQGSGARPGEAQTAWTEQTPLASQSDPGAEGGFVKGASHTLGTEQESGAGDENSDLFH